MIYAERALAAVLITLFLLSATIAKADSLTFSGNQDQSVQATDDKGAIVTFAVTAEDASSTSAAVTCTPPSASVFPIGTTTVNCQAIDGTGATSTTSFNIGVFEPATSTATSTEGGSSGGGGATSTPLVIDGTVDVPASCTAVDTDGVSHEYPTASSTSSYLAICALEQALSDGVISTLGLSNQSPSLGLFVTKINDVEASSTSQYWALYQNGSFASLGISSLPVAAGDTIELQLHDFSDNPTGDSLTLHIDSLIATSSATSTNATSTDQSGGSGNTGNGGGTSSSNNSFSVSKALSYLAAHQNSNGSFDTDDITDWAAIALAGSGSGSLSKMKSYEQSASPTMHSTIDYERHAMALEALGINPWNGTSNDYVTPIVKSFNGTNMGGTINVDIFALYALLFAGYSPNDPMMQQEVSFILSQQKSDGSWGVGGTGDPDMTAAAIQALGAFFGISDEMDATLGAHLGQASGYLIGSQQSDGSWGDSVDSTSWVLTMINAIPPNDPNATVWTDPAAKAGDYLASQQQSDGAMRLTTDTIDNRVWSTSYAIVAAATKSWLSILKPFGKPSTAPESGGGGSSSNGNTATSTGAVLGAATSTLPTATSTTPIAVPLTAEVIAPPPATVPPTHTMRTSVRESQPYDEYDETAGATTSAATSTPADNSGQTAAAASGGENFFSRIWEAIIGFFGHLFGML